MDARPFRPSRALPMPGDENAPLVARKQTLHQRHKSTGNMLTMGSTGSLQVAAKRTVFADVSNTAKALLPDTYSTLLEKSKPSLVEAGKEKVGKGNSAHNEGFTRPAQRLSTKASSILPSISNAHIAAVLNDTRPSQPIVKQTTSKKAATIIYSDCNSTAQKADAELAVDVDNRNYSMPSQDPIVRQPRHHQSQPVLKATQPILRRQASNLIQLPVVQSEANWVPFRPDDDITEEVPYLDAVEEIVAEDKSCVSAALSNVAQEELQAAMNSEQPRLNVKVVEFQPHEIPAPLSALEPEGYSDYEEEEDFYDDQGYTTAHSYRSRGDSTTVMTQPGFTKKDKVELETARQIVESQRTEEELEEEAWDVSMVAEYGDEIFGYMRDLEDNMLPSANYMDDQTEIQWSMRSVLMDWVVQVHMRFGLLPETLFLTVNYIDRFLTNKVVSLGKLQLVGATALFIAAKYEEINCPSVQEIVYMVDGGYTVDEILKAERFMLSMLRFELGWPGPMSFLRRISKADDYDLETRTLAKYFLEVTIMDERFVASRASYIAAGAHCLSRLILRKGDWSPHHVHYSGYTYKHLQPLLATILDCCSQARKHHAAVFEKYSDKRYKRASTYVEGELTKGFSLPHQRSLPLPISFDPYDDAAALDSYASVHALKMPIPIEG